MEGEEEQAENPPRAAGAILPRLQFHLDAGNLDAIDGLFDNDDEDEQIFRRLQIEPHPHHHHHDYHHHHHQQIAFRIGLNETPLTKAISSARFDHAEKLIEAIAEAAANDEAAAADYLNEGAHAATPLTLCLKGRSGGIPRHLRMAKLLVEKGANVNLRIPNHDLETASESPLELLTNFYLRWR